MKRILACLVLALSLACVRGAAATDAPVSLIITYRAKPERRAEFRAWFERDGAAQFGHWRKAGAFTDAQILFGSLAATSTIDALVILDFAHYTDSARWKEIERKFPGGLSPAALALAAPESSSYADVLTRGAAPTRDPTKAAFMIAFYEVITDTAKYRSYVEGYIAPQMRGWIDDGALGAFTTYYNQAPLGKPWDALLVLEYRDIAGLARRDEVKTAVRAKLATTNPAWVEWSKDKSAIRHELSLFIADAIPLRD